MNTNTQTTKFNAVVLFFSDPHSMQITSLQDLPRFHKRLTEAVYVFNNMFNLNHRNIKQNTTSSLWNATKRTVNSIITRFATTYHDQFKKMRIFPNFHSSNMALMLKNSHATKHSSYAALITFINWQRHWCCMAKYYNTMQHYTILNFIFAVL